MSLQPVGPHSTNPHSFTPPNANGSTFRNVGGSLSNLSLESKIKIALLTGILAFGALRDPLNRNNLNISKFVGNFFSKTNNSIAQCYSSFQLNQSLIPPTFCLSNTVSYMNVTDPEGSPDLIYNNAMKDYDQARNFFDREKHCYDEKGQALIYKAIKGYEKAAYQCYSPAIHQMVNLHDLKIISDSSKQTEEQWSDFATKIGSAEIKYQYAINLLLRSQHEKAVIWLEKAAENGYVPAMKKLGDCYEGRWGVTKNDEKALEFYRLVAAKDGLKFLNFLGIKLLSKNPEEALQCFDQASQLGCKEAPRNLALMYYKGIGVPKNDEEAFKLMKKAVENGNSLCKSALGVMYFKGIGVKANQTEASKYVPGIFLLDRYSLMESIFEFKSQLIA